jgi:hypothetical protein
VAGILLWFGNDARADDSALVLLVTIYLIHLVHDRFKRRRKVRKGLRTNPADNNVLFFPENAMRTSSGERGLALEDAYRQHAFSLQDYSRSKP